MMKQAWRSYLASFHPRYLRKAYDNGLIFPLIYWFVIYPLIMNAVNETVEFYDVMGYIFVRFIPFMIAGWSDIGSKYLMPKAMFLAPMKEQERKEYINNVLLIKIGIMVFMGICIEIIWGIFTGFHIEKVMIIALANLSLGIGNYIATEKKGINVLVGVIVTFTMALIAFLEIGTEGTLTAFCNWFILIVVIVLPIVDVVIIRKKYQETIILAGDYELAYKIEGKVEPKQVTFDLFAKKE